MECICMNVAAVAANLLIYFPALYDACVNPGNKVKVNL